MTPYLPAIITGAVLLYALITGWLKGLLAQIGQIAGLITGVLAARALAPKVIVMLADDAGDKAVNLGVTAVSYALVFLAAYLAVVLLARMLRLMVKVASLGPLDRLCGAVFKAFKWLLLLSLAYNVAVAAGICAPPGPSDGAVERIVYATAPKVLDYWHY